MATLLSRLIDGPTLRSSPAPPVVITPRPVWAGDVSVRVTGEQARCSATAKPMPQHLLEAGMSAPSKPGGNVDPLPFLRIEIDIDVLSLEHLIVERPHCTQF